MKDNRTYQDRKAYQIEYQRKWREEHRESIRKTTQKRSPRLSELRWRHKEYNRKIAFRSVQQFFEWYGYFRDERFYIIDPRSLENPTFVILVNGERRIERLNEPLPTW